MSLPTNAKDRKGLPIATGVLRYFPDAIAAVAELSRIGNDQHNPGQPLHWDRSKSTDHADCLARHLMESGTLDTDGVRHSAKVAWRALALLQTEIEKEVKEPYDGQLFSRVLQVAVSNHPMASEILRDEYERDDQGTGV